MYPYISAGGLKQTDQEPELGLLQLIPQDLSEMLAFQAKDSETL